MQEGKEDNDEGGVVDPTTAAVDAIESATKAKRGIEDAEQGDEEEDRGGGFVTNNRKGGGAIPWWILNDDEGEKRKKKKRKTATKTGKNEDKDQDEEKEKGRGGWVAARDENEGGDGAALVGASAMAETALSAPTEGKDGIEVEGGNKKAPNRTTTPPARTPSSSSLSSSSARDRASEFVRTIPIDVAHSTALRFLVWGRQSSWGSGRAAPSSPRDGGVASDEYGEVAIDGPALLALPPDDRTSHFRRGQNRHLERESHDLQFERLRTMYDPLLVELTTAYPGFLPALFVHIADSVLCLEGARHDRERADHWAT